MFLALPQVPLTFGNAIVALAEENNRLFPDRRITERKASISTGLINLAAAPIGGVPMCHGAGGMAGHVRFGAQTGGAIVILGVILCLVALFFSDSVSTLLRIFPVPVLGVVLFGSVAGAMLPMLLRRLGLDPAAASAPFVATLVDVTGLVIYFTVALMILRGTLL